MSGSLSCPICSEIYKNSDEIYSTSCGHVFHFHCMRQWQSRSTSCPQCREHNPQSHKIYLSFEEPTDTDQKILDLKSQLDQSIINSSESQHQLDQAERNLLEIHLELSKADETFKNLNEKIEYLTIQIESKDTDQQILNLNSQLDTSISNSRELQFQLEQTERNFLETELELTKSKKAFEELNDKIESLTFQNESKETENTVSNNNMTVEIPGEEVIKLQEKIKVLEEKLKRVNMELQKEIQNSTELTVDKMKLNSLLQNITSANLSIQSNLFNMNKLPNLMETKKTTEDRGFTSIVIKGLSENAIKNPLEKIVLKLAQIMDVQFTESYIESTSILERQLPTRHHINVELPSVMVKFKSLHYKNRFLANKSKLKHIPETKEIILHDFNPLFHYAKTLRNYGYKYIYCKSNVVFVKKTNTTPPVKIFNKEQVDAIKADANPKVTENQTCFEDFFDN